MISGEKFTDRLERALNKYYAPNLFKTRLVEFGLTVWIYRIKERHWGPFKFKRKIFLGEIEIETSYSQNLNIKNKRFIHFIDDIVLEYFRHDLVWDDTKALKAAISRLHKKTGIVIEKSKPNITGDQGFEIHGAL